MAVTSESSSVFASPKHLMGMSKMRKLNDARRQWESRHCSNSPFRADLFGKDSDCNSSFNGSEGTLGAENSPLSASKGFSFRLIGANGTTPAPLNLSNKQASTFKQKSSKQAQGHTNSPVSGQFGSTNNSDSSNGSSISDRSSLDDDEILEGFGDQVEQPEPVFMEGVCFLKTKTDRFKQHWAVLDGQEIYCYRNPTDEKSRVMHCLAGTFVKTIDTERCPDSHKQFFPVKLVLPPNKSRILYFETEREQRTWLDMLLKALGFTNIFDFYDLGKTLGKGQFGLVRLASHKKTGQQVAVKTVRKANMKQIEVFQQRREIEVLKMC